MVDKMNLLVFNLKTDASDDVLGFTTDWVNGLATHCENVFVVTMAVGRIAVAQNVRVYSAGKERGYSEPRRVIEFYRLLIGLLRAERIDVCFAHMMPLFAVLGWPLLRLYRIPIMLWYAHGHVSPLLRIATVLVDRVVTSSRGGFRLPTRKLRVVGQGIDVARFCPAASRQDPKKRFVLLTVGRISPVKHLEVLIEALAHLSLQLTAKRNVVVRFVGDPLTQRDREYCKSLRRRAKELGVFARVEFLPAVPFTEIHRVYRDADVFVNSSETNSVDKTVLEAMATGLPVVTSNPAFADILDPSHVSMCMVPKGDPDALAIRLTRFIEMSDELRHAYGASLRGIVSRKHALEGLCNRIVGELVDIRDE